MTTDPNARLAVIFLHLHKTAGTSLRELLSAHYRPEEIHVESPPREEHIRASVEKLSGPSARLRAGPPPKSPLPFVEEIQMIPEDRRRRLRLLMGHFWFGVHQLLEQPSTYVTVLRDPVDRTLSLFQHWARFYGLDIGLERFVSELRYRFDNEQTRRIAGGLTRDRPFVDCTREMLVTAKRNLREHFAVVGVTERIIETVVLLGGTLGWSHITKPRRVNVSERPPRQDIPPDVIARIEALNVYDRELHAYAGALLEEGLSREHLHDEVQRFQSAVDSLGDAPWKPQKGTRRQGEPMR